MVPCKASRRRTTRRSAAPLTFTVDSSRIVNILIGLCVWVTILWGINVVRNSQRRKWLRERLKPEDLRFINSDVCIRAFNYYQFPTRSSIHQAIYGPIKGENAETMHQLFIHFGDVYINAMYSDLNDEWKGILQNVTWDASHTEATFEKLAHRGRCMLQEARIAAYLFKDVAQKLQDTSSRTDTTFGTVVQEQTRFHDILVKLIEKQIPRVPMSRPNSVYDTYITKIRAYTRCIQAFTEYLHSYVKSKSINSSEIVQMPYNNDPGDLACGYDESAAQNINRTNPFFFQTVTPAI